MATFKRFEEIEAWQKARALVSKIYSLSNQGKLARDFGLRDQQYIDARAFETLVMELEDTARMISGLIEYLKSSDIKGPKYKPRRASEMRF